MEGLLPIPINPPILAASIPALEELIAAAKITHNKNTPIKPAINAWAGFCGKSIEIPKAIMAMVHQGKYKPAIKERMAITMIDVMKRMVLV